MRLRSLAHVGAAVAGFCVGLVLGLLEVLAVWAVYFVLGYGGFMAMWWAIHQSWFPAWLKWWDWFG